MLIDTKNDFSSNQSALNNIAWLSFLWSCASLMVYSILPAFVVDELNINHSQVGWIEGLAISSSFMSKFFSGVFSDISHARKPLILLGTSFSVITKTLFALSTGAYTIFMARLVDRLSKGIRAAPADALIADLSEPEKYASAFALKQTLGSLGAVFGAVLTTGIMLISGNNYKLVFWLSLIPAMFAVLLLIFFIKPNPKTHPRNSPNYTGSKLKLDIKDFSKFSLEFWWLLFSFFFLMLARFSEAFITLQGKNVGFSVAFLPFIIIIMNLFDAAAAIPSGKIADKKNRKKMLLNGMFIIIIADFFISYNNMTGFIIGIILIGVHVGITQGLLRALIAQSTPAELRGTAFSLFFLVSGAALLIGNVVAGKLSDTFGLKTTFLGGSVFSLISIILLSFSIFKEHKKTNLQVY